MCHLAFCGFVAFWIDRSEIGYEIVTLMCLIFVLWPSAGERLSESVSPEYCRCPGCSSGKLPYFPIQNWLKIMSSKSSVAVLPTTSPTALTAMRKSMATNSSVKSLRKASSVRSIASRARRNAS